MSEKRECSTYDDDGGLEAPLVEGFEVEGGEVGHNLKCIYNKTYKISFRITN